MCKLFRISGSLFKKKSSLRKSQRNHLVAGHTFPEHVFLFVCLFSSDFYRAFLADIFLYMKERLVLRLVANLKF